MVNFAHPGILDERVVNFIPASDLEVKQNFALYVPEIFVRQGHYLTIFLGQSTLPWRWDVQCLLLILTICYRILTYAYL